MLLSIVLAIGAAVGFGGGYTCFKAQLEVQKIEHKQELAEVWEEVFRLRTQVALHVGGPSSDEISRERDAWGESAAQFCRGMEYYRGLLDNIGRSIGPEAYTADDGSVSEDVLRAKLPEIIEHKLRRNVIELTKAEIQSNFNRVQWAEGLIRQLPETHDGRNGWLLNYGSDRNKLATKLAA